MSILASIPLRESNPVYPQAGNAQRTPKVCRTMALAPWLLPMPLVAADLRGRDLDWGVELKGGSKVNLKSLLIPG